MSCISFSGKTKRFTKQNLRFSRHVWAVARWHAAELSTYVSMVVIGRNGDAKWAPTLYKYGYNSTF